MRRLMIMTMTVALAVCAGGAASAGTGWMLQYPRNPVTGYSHLYAVSCISAANCIAVGQYSNNNGFTYVPLAERQNGTTWTVQPTPNPGGSGTNLNAVSCASATDCTAVGSYSTKSGFSTLAEHWNGSTWAIQPTPTPSGVSKSELLGVSCPSATSCTATGDYRTSSGFYQALAEHWNGSTWAVQSTPSMPSSLDAVSCPRSPAALQRDTAAVRR
jgi:hypothetical protein